MSTSISLTVSAEQENIPRNSKTSKSFCDLRKTAAANTSDCCHSRPSGEIAFGPLGESPTRTIAGELLTCGRWGHAGGLVGSSREPLGAQFEPRTAASKLRRWRHHTAANQAPVRQEDSHDDDDDDDDEESSSVSQRGESDFYAEVDERMSRNSLEYPSQQAKYIDRWLNETATGSTGARSRSFEETNTTPQRGPLGAFDSDLPRGNVIGIRGFSSESFIAESKRCREDYTKLKQEHLKLQADYRRLRAHLDETVGHQARASRRREADLEALRTLVVKQGRELDELRAAAGQQQVQVQQTKCDKRHAPPGAAHDEACGLLRSLVEELKGERERLRETVQEREREVRHLSDQVSGLKLEPENRKLMALASENAHLRDATHRDRREYETLRAKYAQLETSLKSLMESQTNLSHDQGEELKRTLQELCRFQVNQPRLELLLETEAQIKVQLQEQIASLQEEKVQLEERIVRLEGELNEAKLRTRSHKTNELERSHAEVKDWQDKCRRLEEANTQLEEFRRTARAKAAQLEARARDELEQVHEAHLRELQQVRAESVRHEADSRALKVELSKATNQLAERDDERREAREEMLELRKRLELAESSGPSERARKESLSRKLEASEAERAKLAEELASCAGRGKDLAGRLEFAEAELALVRRQNSDMKRRFDLQQKSLDELRSRKDRELAKLRVDLNFEQYNRQVSLRGIEKELRASLRELEAMKFRFSKRPSPLGGAKLDDSTAPLCSPPSRACCNRREHPGVATCCLAAASEQEQQTAGANKL